jgi:cytoskeleton protein RodZ
MTSSSNQADKLAEIGAKLKLMREEKDIALHQVTASTLIAERHLRAIEEGNLSDLPEPIYIRGFIRKYGETVGLRAIADDFPLAPIIEEKKTWSKSPAGTLRPLHLYALYILVIGGAVGTLAAFLNPPLANKIDDSKTNLSKAAQLNPKASPKPAKIAPIDSLVPAISAADSLKNLGTTVVSNKNIPNPNNSDNASANDPSFLVGSTGETLSNTSSLVFANNMFSQDLTSPSFSFTGNKPVNVGVVLTGRSWIRVIVDGKIEFEGVVSEGKKLSWSGDQRVAIRAGNAGAVTVTFNNLPSEQLGKEGEVIEKRFDQSYKPTASTPSSTIQIPSIGSTSSTTP